MGYLGYISAWAAAALSVVLSAQFATAQPLSGTLLLSNGQTLALNDIKFHGFEVPTVWLKSESNTETCRQHIPISTAEFFWEEVRWEHVQRIDVLTTSSRLVNLEVVLIDGTKKAGPLTGNYLAGTEVILAEKVVLGSTGKWRIPMNKVLTVSRTEGAPAADRAFIIEDDTRARHSVRNACFGTRQEDQPKKFNRYSLKFNIDGTEVFPGDEKLASVSRIERDRYEVVMKTGEKATGRYIGAATHVLGQADRGKFFIPFDQVKKIEFR